MPPIELTPKQRSFLKSLAHDKEPLLQIGKNGVSDAFVKELEAALAREEVVKVRIGKFVGEELAAEAATKVGATLVAHVGRTVIYYRAGEEPQIALPE